MSEQAIEQVQCFACKVALEPRPQPDCQSFWACPKCGVGDTAENALTEASEYAVEQSARYFQEIMRKNFGGGGVFQLTQTPIPERRYRFFADIEAHLPEV